MNPDARTTALSILNRLDKGNTTLDRELEKADATDPALSGRDRSLLNTLVYGVLRWRGKIDWIITRFSNIPIKKVDPRVFNILRLGVYQILYLDRIPDSAAVNTSVDMTKSVSPPWVTRYVNGMLRNIARKQAGLASLPKTSDPVSRLAVETAFPEWMVKRWSNRFGLDNAGLLLNEMNQIPPITVRNNSLRSTRDQLTEALSPHVKSLRLTPYSSEGISFEQPQDPVHDMPAFENGWFQVQDEAAQLVTVLLNPQPGESILDACAGLGGKTGHIGQIMENKGSILALDRSRKKLSMLSTEMKRLGLSLVGTRTVNLSEPPDSNDGEAFDRILVDAPCSGMGVIRRNPDIKWRLQEKDLKALQQRQILFLNHVAPLVKPMGILNYTVCSMEPEETNDVVSAFLGTHPGFAVQKNAIKFPSEIQSLIDTDGYFRTCPHLHGMDGFFSVNFLRLYSPE